MLSRYFSVDFDGKEACQEETSCPSRLLNPGLSMMEKKIEKTGRCGSRVQEGTPSCLGISIFDVSGNSPYSILVSLLLV